jgi:hypothetical protein
VPLAAPPKNGPSDGGVPPRPNPKEHTKLVREKMGEELRTRKYGRDTKQTRASCYLYLPLISLALRSDGVLYLTRQMKEIDLGVDSK